jgi:hypothetical protein
MPLPGYTASRTITITKPGSPSDAHQIEIPNVTFPEAKSDGSDITATDVNDKIYGQPPTSTDGPSTTWNRGGFDLLFWDTNTKTGTVVAQTDDLPALSGSITGATNATPIVITSANHGLATNQLVVISGVGGNTAANNTAGNQAWVITKIDANTFSLNNSAGNGAYTSGGSWLLAKQIKLQFGNPSPPQNYQSIAKTYLSQVAPATSVLVDESTVDKPYCQGNTGVLEDGAGSAVIIFGASDNNAQANGKVWQTEATNYLNTALPNANWTKTELINPSAGNAAAPLGNGLASRNGDRLVVLTQDTSGNVQVGKGAMYVYKRAFGSGTWSGGPGSGFAPLSPGQQAGAYCQVFGNMQENLAGDRFILIQSIKGTDTALSIWAMKCPAGADERDGTQWVNVGGSPAAGVVFDTLADGGSNSWNEPDWYFDSKDRVFAVAWRTNGSETRMVRYRVALTWSGGVPQWGAYAYVTTPGGNPQNGNQNGVIGLRSGSVMVVTSRNSGGGIGGCKVWLTNDWASGTPTFHNPLINFGTYPYSGNVTGATNASPIVITAVGSNLQSGVQVVISGVLGNTAANGTFTITRVDADHFSLNGSTGNGAYTSGGTWILAGDTGTTAGGEVKYGQNAGLVAFGWYGPGRSGSQGRAIFLTWFDKLAAANVDQFSEDWSGGNFNNWPRHATGVSIVAAPAQLNGRANVCSCSQPDLERVQWTTTGTDFSQKPRTAYSMVLKITAGNPALAGMDITGFASEKYVSLTGASDPRDAKLITTAFPNDPVNVPMNKLVRVKFSMDVNGKSVHFTAVQVWSGAATYTGSCNGGIIFCDYTTGGTAYLVGPVITETWSDAEPAVYVGNDIAQRQIKPDPAMSGGFSEFCGALSA